MGAVVVGWDPHFSYSRIVYASVCLRELPGCALVATNLDCADHIGGGGGPHGEGRGGRMMPGTGGLVAAVEVASGVKAVSARERERAAAAVAVRSAPHVGIELPSGAYVHTDSGLASRWTPA